MSKRPSFQFYPSDWLSNSNLRRCTFEERGVWVQVLCLLHDSEEYGILRWPLSDIAIAVGCDVMILESLVKKGVLKGSDCAKEKVSFSTSISQKNAPAISVALIDAQCGALWYSSRMVRDEYIRRRRSDGGFKSLEHPNVPKKKQEKDAQKDIEKDTFSPSPSSSSSSSSSKIKDIAHSRANTKSSTSLRFNEFWNIYPRKKDKQRAIKAWQKAKLDERADFIIADVANRIECDESWKEKQFIPHPSNYLNGERWEDEITKFTPEKKNGNGAAKNELRSTVPWFKPEHGVVN